MKYIKLIFLCLIMIAASACSQKKNTDSLLESQPPISDADAADETDEASLLATAKEAGVSQEDALAAKAELDKVYDETSAKMDEAELERNARFKKLKDDVCVANCPDD